MKQSLRAAINAKCRDCAYDPLDAGAWKEQVTLCQGTTCPLYPVRPTSSGARINQRLQEENGNVLSEG